MVIAIAGLQKTAVLDVQNLALRRKYHQGRISEAAGIAQSLLQRLCQFLLRSAAARYVHVYVLVVFLDGGANE